jgi:hypothetical protein
LPDETLRPIKCIMRGRGFKQFLLQFSGLNFINVCRCHRIFLSDVGPLSKSRRFINSKNFNFPKGTQKNGPKIIAVNRSLTSSESFCIHKTGVRLLNFPWDKSDRKRQNVQKYRNRSVSKGYCLAGTIKLLHLCLVFTMLLKWQMLSWLLNIGNIRFCNCQVKQT